jgi:ferredoxin-NADP reductase
MLRHSVVVSPERRVTLLYSVRTVADIAFREELQWLSARHPQARVLIVVSGDGGGGAYRQGRIDENLVREVVPAPGRAAFFICGPASMIDAMRQMLERMGVPAERVHYEAFQAAAALASEAARSGDAGAPARATFRASRVEVDVRPGETLLEAGERAGAGLASFCRAGICGTCRTRVAAGDVRCEGEALTDEERRQGWVLPCVAHAAGDCVLEA